jgi:tetratricopeptide (TPR) repeat protein
MGRYQEAQGYLEESLAIAREIADKSLIAVVLQPLAMASLGQGDFVAARGYLEEALVLARDLGNKRELAAALNALAQVHRAERAPNMAEPLYKQVLTLARELEDREIIAIALLNLAMVSIDEGSGDRARSALIEVRAIAEEIGSKPAAQSVLEVCAGLGALTTEWQRTARFFGAAEAQTRETGLHRDPTDEAFLAPLIAKARAAMGESAYMEAEAAGRALSYEEVMAEARAWLENGS